MDQNKQFSLLIHNNIQELITFETTSMQALTHINQNFYLKKQIRCQEKNSKEQCFELLIKGVGIIIKFCVLDNNFIITFYSKIFAAKNILNKMHEK